MRYVCDVYTAIFEYLDEADTTYLDNAKVQRAMRSAYDYFRNMAADIDPYLFTREVSITLTNTAAYDLAAAASAVRLLGNPAGGLTGPRLLRLLTVHERDATTNLNLRQWRPVGTTEGMFQYDVFMLDGTVLRFPNTMNATLWLVYLAYPSKPDNTSGIDWTKTASTDTEWIDDLVDFHDVIALRAAVSLARMEGAKATGLKEELADRVEDMRRRLSQGRVLFDNNIQQTYSPIG